MRRWGLAVLITLSCSAVAKEQLYSPPRLDNGQPDMQGVWVASNGTPLTYYTRPWTGESHFLRSDEQLLEFACHEANYSLVHILEGARVRERQ